MAVNGSADSSVMMLSPGFWGHALNPGRNGRNFPIDSSKYQVLSYKLLSSATEDPQIYWVHNPSSHPSGSGLGGRVAPRTFPGTQLVVADLTQSLIPGLSPWTDGPVLGLRLDPNAFNAVENVFLYWVRLTPSANSPLARKQTITWTGSGAATITVRDNSDGSVFPVVSGLSGNSYLWNYGVLAPGSYTLTVTNASGSGSATFTHQQPAEHRADQPVCDKRRRLRHDGARQPVGHEQRCRYSTDRKRLPHEPVVQRGNAARDQHQSTIRTSRCSTTRTTRCRSTRPGFDI